MKYWNNASILKKKKNHIFVYFNFGHNLLAKKRQSPKETKLEISMRGGKKKKKERFWCWVYFHCKCWHRQKTDEQAVQNKHVIFFLDILTAWFTDNTTKTSHFNCCNSQCIIKLNKKSHCWCLTFIFLNLDHLKYVYWTVILDLLQLLLPLRQIWRKKNHLSNVSWINKVI